HVVRGGAWNTIMRELRSASRYAGQTVDNTYGFRVARTLAVVDGTQASDISHTAAPGGDVAAAGAGARRWGGFRVQAVTPELVAKRGLTVTRGILVATAQPDSPAAHAGIESGDVITAINGRDIGDARDLARTISTVLPGDTVRLSVIRRGQEKTFNMTIGALPERR